jgi:hypothetical protein
VVLGCEVRREQSEGRDVELSRSEEVQDHGKAAGRPCRDDAVVGLVVGEREDVAQ